MKNASATLSTVRKGNCRDRSAVGRHTVALLRLWACSLKIRQLSFPALLIQQENLKLALQDCLAVRHFPHEGNDLLRDFYRVNAVTLYALIQALVQLIRKKTKWCMAYDLAHRPIHGNMNKPLVNKVNNILLYLNRANQTLSQTRMQWEYCMLPSVLLNIHMFVGYTYNPKIFRLAGRRPSQDIVARTVVQRVTLSINVHSKFIIQRQQID